MFVFLKNEPAGEEAGLRLKIISLEDRVNDLSMEAMNLNLSLIKERDENEKLKVVLLNIYQL